MPIQITYEGDEDGLLETQISQCFNALDAQFSTYRKTSDVILFNKKKLPAQDDAFKKVLAACTDWKHKTNGAFDAFYSGAYDPSGYVKGLAIQQASELLHAADIHYFSINASGDVLTASNIEESWNIALQNPKNKHTSFGVIKAKNLAIATSGTYERGAHIINPKTGKPTKKLLAITVIGKDIVTADVLATAAFACSDSWQTIINSFDGYEALAIDIAGSIAMTNGFESLVS